MLPDAITQSVVWGPVFALSVFALMLLLAIIAHFGLRFAVNFRQSRIPEGFDSQILEAIKGPLVLFIALSGAFLGFISLTQVTDPSFDGIRDLDEGARKTWLIVIVVAASYATSHILQAMLRWYLQKLASRTATTLDDKFVPIVNRILPVVVYSLGLLIVLDILTVPISPLLAGLGIGGLAVALALSPTLSSFIAGTYVVTEGQIKEDDYIEMDNGLAGFVVDVGWRSTRIRSRFNNIVIIPNNRLTDSIVTNYSTPTPVLTGIVECGVSYDSDLEQVERVSLEVAGEVIRESELAVKDFEPLVRFDEFGDSNINFRIIFQATDRIASFAIKSGMIKRLHSRFNKEGIEINYPVRKLLMPSPDGHFELLQPQEARA